ncbi:MAG: TIGR04255 family protein [Actinomycetota bacterium]|nr:TIGR04255 family protein [Actinomycetota bacterium]
MAAHEEPSGHLASFDEPPVAEVAAGIQFRSLFGVRGIALGPLRERWREQYPHVQEMPPLPPQIEASPAGGPVFQLGFGPVPSSRYWFLNEDHTELVQVQNDRLVVNWRRGSKGGAYPRYGAIRGLFADRRADLEAFLAEETLGVLDVVQVELTYINSIPELVNRPADEVLSGLRWPQLDELGRPEQVRASASFVVPEMGVTPVRLYLSVEPGTELDGGPTAFLTVTVRGAAEQGNGDTTLAFLDEAHEHVVRSFTEVTTESMHRTWKRTQ